MLDVRHGPMRFTSPPKGENLMPACTHLDQVEVTDLPESVDGCEECLKVGGAWLHLRIASSAERWLL